MANVFDALSNETLQKVADGGDLWGSMTNEELQKIAAGGYDDPIPGMDHATQSAPVQPAQPAPRQRVSSYEEAIARAQQPGQGEGGFWSGVGEAISEGAKGAGRAVKEGVGGLVVNTVSGLTRLAGTPVRALTGWEGLHKLANAIDESYANFGAQALESEYGANPDGFGYGAGRFGENLTGIAGNLGGLAAPGGIAKAGAVALPANAAKVAKVADAAARGIAKIPGARTTAAAVQKSFPYMFGNNAAVQAYDTARENGKSKAEATALAGLNGAIHFLGFKAFESQSLNKMLGMPKSMEAMMPKWANEAMAESAPKTFTELARSVRNGMIKHTLAERGRGMLKAGGIMALQDMLSDIPMQVAEGGSWDNIDFNRVGKKGLEGLEEGALMEGAMGAAAMLRSNKSARNFLADKIYRNGYDVVSPSGKVYHEPGLLQTPQQRMALMKQNPDATERVLDIIEHGGVARPDELDAAFLPPDMSEKEQRKFAADWRKDLEPYVEEAWNADKPKDALPAPDMAAAEAPRREFISPDEARAQQKAINDAAERRRADNKAQSEVSIDDYTVWNDAYRRGVTNMSLDEWLATKAQRDAMPRLRAPTLEEEADELARRAPEPDEPIKVSPMPEQKTDDSAIADNGRNPDADAYAQAQLLREQVQRRIDMEEQGEKGRKVQKELDNFSKAVRNHMDVFDNDTFGKENAELLSAVEDAIRKNNTQLVKENLNKLIKQVRKFSKRKLQNQEGENNETGNVRDEASARPEEGTVEGQEPAAPVREAPGRVEAQPKSGETARVVKTAAEPLKTPQDAPGLPEVGKATPEPEKPAEAVSAAPAEPPAPAERPAEIPAVEETPAPREETLVAEPEEKAAPAPTNRLKRRDGTDPLAEKEEQAKGKGKRGAPHRTDVQKLETVVARYAKKAKAIYDRIVGNYPEGELDSLAFRKQKGNGGLKLGELRTLVELADDGWHKDLGLPEKEADRLLDVVKRAYEEQRVGTPGSQDGKVNEAGTFNYSVKASNALTELKKKPKSIAAIAKAQYNVMKALDAARRHGEESGDRRTEQYFEQELAKLDQRIAKLSDADARKFVKATRAEERKESIESQAQESGGTALNVAEGESARSGVEYSDAARLGRITERDDAAEGGAEKPQGVSRDWNKAGDRHIQLETKGGKKYVVWRNEFDEVVKRAPMDALRALAKASPEMKALVDKLEAGEEIRASKATPESPEERDLRFAADENYQKWLKSRKANDAEPLRERYEQEQAKAAKSIARNTLPGVDVEIVDRAFNPETDGGVGKRKSISGIFTGGPNDYANRSRQGGIDDGPSLKSIGTGEGTQVYGWGLYGSNRRGVAESYARAGKNKSARLEFDGKEWDENAGDWGVNSIMTSYLYANDPAYSNSNGGDFATRLRRQAEIYKQQIDDIERNGKSDPEYMFLEKLRRAETMLSEAANDPKHTLDRIKEISPTANVYEQTFFTDRAPGDESHLLKWYEPVSEEQAEWILDALKDMGLNKSLLEQYLDRAATGREVYERLSEALGSSKAASESLARAGIDGVKYPVNSYGGKGVKNGDEVGWNYVSFRDDNIRVDHKWTDDQMRYLRDGEGRVVGTFDRSTNKVKLYRGASAATLVHELGGHATLRFAEQEAERGNRQLLDRINRAIDEAPQALKDEVRSRYPGVDETALRDEIWAALRERNSPAMEKAIKTLQGKAWYNRAWSAFKDAWKGLLARMGFNRADLSQIDKMSNDEFLSHLDRIMSDGKTLGRLEAMGEGTRANPLAESQESVREARSPRPAGSRIMDDQQTKGEKFTEKFIDSLVPVKSVQDELGGVKEITRADGYTDHTKSTDLVAAKDKANGRLEHEVRQHQFRVDDINRDLSRAALPKQSTEDLVDDFNLYLQCKHAPERNLSVAQDRGDAYTPDYSEGMGQITLPGGNRIGLSENVADRLLKGMRGKYGLKFKMFENAADKVYKMLEADLDRRFDAGRLSAEDYAFYKTRWHGPGGADGKWAHYVPLKTDMERLEPEALNSSTAGMKRNEFMKAQGRGTGDIADSPLAAAVLQTEQGIRGSIKNEVANVEANLVEHAQKQGIPIAEIVPGDEIRRGRTYSFTFADGETVDASGSMRLVENHPEIHLFKRDGKLYAIRYDKGANGRGLAFAKAASGENMSRWGQGTEWIPRMTHWMSAMRTQYSPEFTVSNWLADHLEAAQALVGRYGLKEGGKAFAKTVASEIQNWKDLRAYLNGGQANGYIKEFVEGGGLTKGGVASEGFDAETQKIRSKIEQFRREQKQWREMSPADLAKSAGRHVADFLSFANELAEYSTRTGLYTALRKQGVPQAEAIKFARDATVNFNRKGTAMPYINGLYMFANASVQGAVRSVQAMRDTHGKELVAALTAIGVAKAVIDNYLGNDDEREAAGGRNARNQSEYDKKHNVGVPIGGGRQIVPLRFRGPYAAIPYLAQTAANVAMGATSPEDGAKTLFRELGDQVTGIVGGNGIMNDRGELDGSLIGQSIAPSVADPIVQLATGKDYKGDERRRKSFDKTMPASSNGKRSTASGYKWLAKGVNAIPFLSGGNEFRKGRLDFSPEDYKLVLEFLLGAPMRDFNNVVSSVDNAVQLASGGTPERTLSQIPFVRRVVREYPESTSRYYDALEEYERDKAEFKKTTDIKRRREMKKEKPYLFTGKSLLDGQIDKVKELTHLERGEVKSGNKWVEPKTPRSEAQKEKYRELRLKLQATILRQLKA